jgi:hypothetical protein
MSGSQGATGNERVLTGGEKGLKAKAAKAPRVSWDDVRIRALTDADIEAMVTYYYHSGMRDPIAAQQVDYSKYPAEEEYRQFLHAVVIDPAKAPTVIVEWRGRAIGVHMLTSVRGSEADFQAAFWQPQDRGMGVGTVSCLKACAYFFANFAVDRLHFRVTMDNKVGLALAKKLPLNFVGEQNGLPGPYPSSGAVRVYALSRAEFEDMSFTEDEDEGTDAADEF